jgi:hypothetical protein
MPKHHKQLALADKAAERAADDIAHAITTLTEEVAALPAVPFDYVAEQVAQWLYKRHHEAYVLVQEMT